MRNTETKTITYLGIDMEIEFMYYPGEDAVTYYPDGSGYPGCGEEFEIDSISVGGIDIVELLSTKQENDIIDELSRTINN